MFDTPVGLLVREWDPVKDRFVDPGEDEEESYDEDSDDDEDFDYCTPEEREAYMKEVRENEAACIVIPQAIDDYPYVPGQKRYEAHQDPMYEPSEVGHMLPTVCKTEGMNGIKKEEIRNEETLEERLKDFEGEKMETAPVVKTEWEHIMIKYFRMTEKHMPDDPVRELELSVKKEREDEIAAKIKSEPRFDIPEKKRRDPNQIFKCKLCPAEFKSKYSYTIHVNKHPAKCVNCHITYKNWFELRRHEIYCTRRFGRTLIPPRPQPPKKEKKKPFSCQLCDRKYSKYDDLYDHQVKRCKKRYISNRWVVKI